MVRPWVLVHWMITILTMYIRACTLEQLCRLPIPLGRIGNVPISSRVDSMCVFHPFKATSVGKHVESTSFQGTI